MKTPLEFLYEFYPHLEKETIKNDLIRFCEAYEKHLDTGKPKEKLNSLIELRDKYYNDYQTATGPEKKVYRKQWKDIDSDIFNLIQGTYKHLTIRIYKNEFEQQLFLVKTKDILINQVLKNKEYKYNSFTNCFEKEIYDNTFFSFIKNIALYL